MTCLPNITQKIGLGLRLDPNQDDSVSKFGQLGSTRLKFVCFEFKLEDLTHF